MTAPQSSSPDSELARQIERAWDNELAPFNRADVAVRVLRASQPATPRDMFQFSADGSRLLLEAGRPASPAKGEDSTCYIERSMVRIGVMGTGDEALLKYVDSLPIFTASDFTARCSADSESARELGERIVVETERLLELEAAFFVSLAENNCPPDIAEFLMRGDPMRGIPPRLIQKAIKAAISNWSAL